MDLSAFGFLPELLIEPQERMPEGTTEYSQEFSPIALPFSQLNSPIEMKGENSLNSILPKLIKTKFSDRTYPNKWNEKD